jgi:micrococcal nuclease
MTFTDDEALYFYKAELARVVDGDTVDLTLDLGFRMRWTQRFRLLGIDTPELNSTDSLERVRAKEAAAFLGALLTAGEVRVLTARDRRDKYGRWLVTIFVREPRGWLNVNEALRDAGLARSYAA